MKLKVLFMCSGILFLANSIRGAEKATVITESGKMHSVFFLSMHNDTIYLKVPKEDRTFFSISGHKSRFRMVEFANGKKLDFSLSNYPPDAPMEKPSVGAARDTSVARDTAATPSSSELAQALTAARDSTFRADPIALSQMATKMRPAPRADHDSVKQENPPPALEKSIDEQMDAERKVPHRGRGTGIGLTALSLAALAGGATMHVLSLDDRNKAAADKRFLEQSAVPGPAFDAKVRENRQLTNSADRKTIIAAGLAGIGSAGFCVGIILVF